MVYYKYSAYKFNSFCLLTIEKVHCIESEILWHKKGHFSTKHKSVHKKSRRTAGFLYRISYIPEYWRMVRDLNPRRSYFIPCPISSRMHSTALPTIQNSFPRHILQHFLENANIFKLVFYIFYKILNYSRQITASNKEFISARNFSSLKNALRIAAVVV